MLKRTLVFTTACKLSLKNQQLRFQGAKNEEQVERLVPVEDIGFVILESHSIIITSALLRALEKNNTAVVLCDESHHPCAVMQSYCGNNTHSETLRCQIEAALPLKKRIWKDIVSAKINNQADLIDICGKSGQQIRGYARSVKSGDSDNREGMAAKSYWRLLFGDTGFKRIREGEMPNPLLNYGYAILRAASARALISSGLYCAIGVHHHNRYNAFCLVDDFMEPYRPFVDRLVYKVVQERGVEEEISTEVKKELLSVLTSDVVFKTRKRPLLVGLSESSAALVRCFKGESRTLCFPTLK